MKPFPPYIEKFFESERRNQINFNKLAQAKGNLRYSTARAIQALDKVIKRGEQLDAVEEKSEQLLESSNVFRLQVSPPWWKRCCCECFPKWWFNREEEEEEEKGEEWNVEFIN